MFSHLFSIERILTYAGGENLLPWEMARHFKYLSWEKLETLRNLIEEYNVEWALASVEWENEAV